MRPLTAPIALLVALSAPLMLAVPVGAQEAAPAAAAGPAAAVAVRAGIHADHNRLVFDWPRSVEYRVERSGNRVTVRFPGTTASADLRAALKTRTARIAGLSASNEGGLAVSFTVPEGAQLRDLRAGTRVVVDVLDAPKAAMPTTAGKPPEAQPTQQGQAQPTQQGQAQPTQQGQPTRQAQAAQARQADARRKAEGAPLYQMRGAAPAQPGTAPAGGAPAGGAPAGPAAAGAPTPLAPETQASANTAPANAAPANAPARTAAGKTAPGKEAASKVPPPSAVRVAPPPAATPAPAAAVEAAPVDPGLALPFQPPGPAAAAVFERAGWLYVLFDQPVPPATAPAAGSVPGFSGTIEPVAVEGGAGFRLLMPAMQAAGVTRTGTLWTVTLRRPGDAPGPAAGDLTVTPDPAFALGARLVVQADEAEKVLTFTDPVVGDRLRVVPLPVAGQRMEYPRRYAEAQFLPTLQGVVVRPLDDALLVQPVREGVELTVPGGLHLSSAADAAIANPPPPVNAPDRLWDYARWGQVPPADYMKTRQARWDALIAQPEQDRTRGRLEVARFYLANGLGYEALGMLSLVQEAQPDMDRRPEFLAVRGAARALTGNYVGALGDLGTPLLAAEPDTGLWQAVASAALGDWDTAETLFTKYKDLLARYPEPFFTRFALTAAETALQKGKSEEAALLVDAMMRRGAADGPRAAAVQYMRGLVFRNLGDEAKAEQAFTAAIDSRDQLYWAKAKWALTDMQLAAGKITPKDAAATMESLRFAWAKDRLELAINRRIGEVHALAGNYVQAFETMKRTVRLFPDTPEAKQISQEMIDTFVDLFAKDGAAKMPALEALALYEQYRELTPPGPDGDRIIRKLAERLVEIDLLDRAAALLEYQVDNRLSGLDKSQVGTRLAGIRLLDSRPQEALSALDRTEAADLPPALMAERRLLRARALSQTGKGGEALQLLANDTSRPANLLRIDIAMREKQWPVAAAALGDVIGPPPAAGQELPAETAGLVLNRTVALSLARDTAGLDKLRQTFGPAMEKSRDATAFRVLTRPEEAAGLADVATIRSRMAEIDLFRSFLDTYRTKTPDGPGAPGAATPASTPAAPAASGQAAQAQPG
ncbi:tetratricopeptide repeat protein [Oleisolibacter albus]|uniref:tetratricopeptide repeat protein n=1 Tax=Oleisolibacter albus TaxID=2171757 RepID=UPI000DF4A80F|nr:tetratricopeptide repeat protein [Oleisolibacter albus]